MKLLQQLHIWKLRSCAARHERKAKALKRRLLSEIRSLNLEIRHHEHCQQTSSRLASRKAFKLEQGKSLNWQSEGQEEPCKEQETACEEWLAWAKRRGVPITPQHPLTITAYEP